MMKRLEHERIVVTFAIFFIIPVLFCFVFELELYILYECSCV